MRFLLCAIGVLLAITSNLPVAAHAGTLVLVGGGPTPSQIFERTLSLAGGHRAIIAVLPQTYPTDSIADAAVTLWRSFQPREVVKVSRTDPAAMRTDLERSTLIWMPGGFPSFLMRSIEGTPIPDVIRTRFAAGITVGGASAGAVAMSETMLADETTPDGNPIDGPVTIEGLGLWPEAIVSPHFTERHRLAPLIPVVANHPTLFGVGIDEGTAVIVSTGEFEVLGRGTVSIVAPHAPPVRTLKTGMRFRYQLRPPS